MKKSKLSVGLVTAFIGALALAACDSGTPAVTAKENTILDFVGYNNKTDRIEVKTGLYDEISKTEEGTKLYYDAILETLIRSQYEDLSKRPGSDLKSYALIRSSANEKVEHEKQNAKDNASSAGTSYDEEWKKILDAHDCKDEEDLRQFFLYKAEKDEITDWYSKTNIDTLKEEFIGVDDEWSPVDDTKKVENVDSVYPYHILHVLVKLSASKDDYIRGTISEKEAEKLWTVVRNLIDGDNSFEKVAEKHSDDGSASNYGDVGIMSTKTSFYNEFKLGIYAYDSILSGVNEPVNGAAASATNPKNTNIYEAFGLEEDDGTETDTWVSQQIVTRTTQEKEIKENIEDLIQSEMIENINAGINYTSIPTVPYEVFKKISDVAKDEKIANVAPEAGEVAYPRNVLFNRFLNFHSPFVITNEDFTIVEGTEGAKFTDETVTTTPHNFSDNTPGNLYIKNTHFKLGAVPAAPEKSVLVDNNDNVIIGVRSEAGIHFMVMRKSIFYKTNEATADYEPDGTLIRKHNETSLEDYYTINVPSDDEYPEGNPQTYVNMSTVSDKKYYSDRADEIKTELKTPNKFDAGFDYRLYEYLMKEVGEKITFFDEDESGNSVIKTNIDEYIKRLRETQHNGDIESINKAWQSYLMMLKDQNYKRNYTGAMLPSTCSLKFNASNKELFEEGGLCYVKK